MKGKGKKFATDLIRRSIVAVSSGFSHLLAMCFLHFLNVAEYHLIGVGGQSVVSVPGRTFTFCCSEG